MEIICYRTKSGCCPVKEYFSRYIIGEKDQMTATKKLVKIDSIIRIAAERGGVVGGEFSSSLIGYDFQESRIQENVKLIRILYFAFRKEKLVLLNVLDKPKQYEKSRKRKVDREIEKVHKETQMYYEDFLENPNQYETYE